MRGVGVVVEVDEGRGQRLLPAKLDSNYDEMPFILSLLTYFDERQKVLVAFAAGNL